MDGTIGGSMSCRDSVPGLSQLSMAVDISQMFAALAIDMCECVLFCR